MEQYEYAIKMRAAEGNWVLMPLFYNDSVQARSLADRYLKGDVYGGDLDYEVIRRRVGEWETYTGDLTD